MTSHQETLAAVPLFADLPKQSIKRLDDRITERSFAAGEEIVTEGDPGIGFYLIASGAAEVHRGSHGSAIRRFHTGDFFGEMALLDNAPRSATVRAVEPTNCLIISRWDFLAELKSDPEMMLHVLQATTRRLRAADQRIEELESAGKS